MNVTKMLEEARLHKSVVEVFLVNGIKLKGEIIYVDNEDLVLTYGGGGKVQIINRDNITTIVT